MKKNIGILGAGTWGTALSVLLSENGHDVTVWSAIKEEVDYINANHVHPKLKDTFLPQNIKFTSDVKNVCENKDIIVFAVPSVFIRNTAKLVRTYITDNQIIISVAKGIEQDTLYTMTEVISDELENSNLKIAALSGPTHAEEVIKKLPTTIVASSDDIKIAEEVQDIFMNLYMRVYTNTDIKGVELCGAMKNIIALSAGISDGLGYGDNAKAALITRGMAEISRLGIEMGCNVHTFYGLTGIGDLVVTATSRHSRNNKAGYYIGTGLSVKEATEKVGMVVEGINAIPAAIRLAEKYNVDMPIVFSVNNIVNGKSDPASIVNMLMNRNKKTEVVDNEN